MDANGLGTSTRHICAVLNFTRELAAGRGNVVAAGFADGGDDTSLSQNGGESFDPIGC